MSWHSPEAGGKHPIMSQGSANGTHQERPELCNPSDNIEQGHHCSWQSAQPNFVTIRKLIREGFSGGNLKENLINK